MLGLPSSFGAKAPSMAQSQWASPLPKPHTPPRTVPPPVACALPLPAGHHPQAPLPLGFGSHGAGRTGPQCQAGDCAGFQSSMQDEAALQRAATAVEKINGPVQFESASRDEMWPSKEMADAMMQRLKANGFRHPAEHLVVQGGHGEPLDEFPKMEAFLEAHFKQACE